MAHFAKLDENNIVTEVIVVHNNELMDENGNESEQKGIDFCANLLGGTWVQTSYNNTFRKRYAGIGFNYDPINDVFLDPQPFPSWTLSSNFDWEPPVPFPAEPWLYSWNEVTRMWDERL
jgi:hypothetical protein